MDHINAVSSENHEFANHLNADILVVVYAAISVPVTGAIRVQCFLPTAVYAMIELFLVL